MNTENPALERYMERFSTALRAFDCTQSDEIVSDLRGHIAEAQSMGKPLDEVLQSIGPADTLARAYAVELALNPRGARWMSSAGGIAKAVGLVAAGSLVTFIVAGVLGSIGIGFSLSGLTMIGIGGLEAIGVHLPHVETNHVPAFVIIMIGVVLTIAGVGALTLLSIYFRTLMRSMRLMLPRNKKAQR